MSLFALWLKGEYTNRVHSYIAQLLYFPVCHSALLCTNIIIWFMLSHPIQLQPVYWHNSIFYTHFSTSDPLHEHTFCFLTSWQDENSIFFSCKKNVSNTLENKCVLLLGRAYSMQKCLHWSPHWWRWLHWFCPWTTTCNYDGKLHIYTDFEIMHGVTISQNKLYSMSSLWHSMCWVVNTPIWLVLYKIVELLSMKSTLALHCRITMLVLTSRLYLTMLKIAQN